jgi:hypothetical protein
MVPYRACEQGKRGGSFFNLGIARGWREGTEFEDRKRPEELFDPRARFYANVLPRGPRVEHCERTGGDAFPEPGDPHVDVRHSTLCRGELIGYAILSAEMGVCGGEGMGEAYLYPPVC